MYKKNKKHKYANYKVPRGGWAAPVTPKMKKGYFSPAIRKVGKDAFDALTKEYINQAKKHITPEKAGRVMERMIEAAAGGSSPKLAALLKEISKPLAPAVSGVVIRLVTPTAGGVSGPPNISIPSFSSSDVRRISGKNSLYTAREHRLSFKAGNTAGKWMRELAKTNSITKEIISDTISDYHLNSADRAKLVRKVGANRREVLFVDKNLFGEDISFVNTLFGLTALDTKVNTNQTAYGALSNFLSKVTLTSLNRYVPMYVKMSLVKNKITINTPLQTFADCYNADASFQENGAIPARYQNSDPVIHSGFYNVITVDPKSPGIRCADNWKNGMEVVYSQTRKLYAGDRLKFDYEHMFSSGINLSKVYGMIKESDDFTSGTQLTYSLMIETWGEEVDVLSLTSSQVIKATCPHAYQLEFAKQFKGIQADLAAGDKVTSSGWVETKYAVKVYTNEGVNQTNRRWNLPYSDMGTQYTVPVMSDAVEQDAGQIT